MVIISKGYFKTSCSFLFPYSAKDTDIIDEAIYYFKANVFFKNYEIKVSGECLYRKCTGAWKMYLRALTRIHRSVLREKNKGSLCILI